MKLGSIDLPTDLILAPMMDTMTPSFRNLIMQQGGVGMIVTPMIFVQQVAAAPKTAIPHLEHIEKQKPSSVQIVASGRNPDHIKKALDFLSSYNFDVLDINGGCPAPHTMKSGGGGGLLRDFHRDKSITRLQNVVETCMKYSHVPVSLKTRLGYENETDILEISKKLEDSGILFLTLHGRTVSQKYRGTANHEIIRQVKEQLNIPIVGNGDVYDYQSYKKMKDQTNCDAVMIGRAAMSDPAVFSKIWQNQQAISKGEDEIMFPDYHDFDTIRQYLRMDDEFISNSSRFWNTDRFKVAELRRLTIWFIKGIPGYKRVREKISKIMDINEIRDYIYGQAIEDDFKQGQITHL
ncbi:tRNA-dihydrouridine synthase B [Candidatus Lokiarchaeum ossiferum]|uniref:tRNA-dihydrouridine synthase B n=1 Tax=Candidatus Lokiarchaeum ossiferum TaxID=2951803 RepID=A0ABY6HM04_9ARCH|nr:tRNA-dihydrouridine synthase B [Candidatus Lokiarchaeum sp. B-35]